MYTFFQPRISVTQEEADIKSIIDEKYERKEQEERDYYKQMEENYYKNFRRLNYGNTIDFPRLYISHNNCSNVEN